MRPPTATKYQAKTAIALKIVAKNMHGIHTIPLHRCVLIIAAVTINTRTAKKIQTVLRKVLSVFLRKGIIPSAKVYAILIIIAHPTKIVKSIQTVLLRTPRVL